MNKINKALLQKRFNKAAVCYDRYANVQKKMGDRLIKQAADACRNNPPASILELGCGTGYVTERLAGLFPEATITAVDFAPAMIEKARKRTGNKDVQFVCSDIEQMVFLRKFDLIISNATFQWFNNLGGTLQKVTGALEQKGILLFSTFGQQTFQELHASFRKAAELTGTSGAIGQTFLAAHELQQLCVHAHAEQVSVDEEMYIERFPTVRAFLESVRKIGAANSNDEKYCQSPSVLKRMMKLYETEFQQDGHVIATYHALFASIIKKGEEKYGTCSNKTGLEKVSV
ncbi:MAG: malonyl-ACP O-methyltransferase BioC [Ectobacillus sp.]